MALGRNDFAARITTPELLDLGVGSTNDITINLNEVARINRYLGGLRALTNHLYPLLAGAPGSPVVVDLGTGSADLLVTLQRWGQRHRRPLCLVGVDFAERHLVIARRRNGPHPALHLVCADARGLPLPSQGVDFVVSTLFLHHFDPAQVVELLRSTYAAARQAVVMSDLVRGWMPYLGFKLVQPVFARHIVTRLDGELSIQRGYTPTELRRLAQAAGLHTATIHTHFPWRMTLVAKKEAAQNEG